MTRGHRIAWLLIVVLGLVWSGCSVDTGGDNSSSSSKRKLKVDKKACFQAVKALNGAQPAQPGAQGGAGDPGGILAGSPFCSCDVAMGAHVPLVAYFENGDQTIEDVTLDVQWAVNKSALAMVMAGGLLSAEAPGEIVVGACFEDICSEPLPINIIENPKVTSLEIFPGYYYPIGIFDDIGSEVPDCWDCFFEGGLRLLIGDTAHFFARGILETGEWVDLTNEVDWHSSVPEVADIDTIGLLSAQTQGQTEIIATYQELVSNSVGVDVLSEAILQDLFIYTNDWTALLRVGDLEQFHADAYFDPWMLKDVTAEVEWIVSAPQIGVMGPEGVFTALAPGIVTIQAQYQDKLSNAIELEVWNEVSMQYCDPENLNRAFWEDEYNRVILETDCAEYNTGGQAVIRYSIEENQSHPWGILDPCLDLVVTNSQNTPIKTLRSQGCDTGGMAVEVGDAADIDPIYQYTTTWDMTDESGAPVAPGAYNIVGTFYIYYDPIITLGITLK